MLSWLRNRRRRIFYFLEGNKRRAADPIVVSVAIKRHPKYLPETLLDAIEGDEEAIGIVAEVACYAFGVAPLSDNGKRGMTVSERVELVAAFQAYMLTVKKNTRLSATKPPSTAATPSGSSEPTTSDTAPSGGTKTAPSSAEPIASGSE